MATIRHDRRPLPGLYGCALLILQDACPPEASMQLCGMLEDFDGGCCTACWEHYLQYVANGRVQDPYASDRRHEGGLIG